MAKSNSRPPRGKNQARPARDLKLLPSGCRHTRGESVRAFLSDHRPVLMDCELECGGGLTFRTQAHVA
jgi:hypothetical protein